MREKTNAHSRDINSVAFSPDGTKIVSGSRDGATVHIEERGGAFYAPSPISCVAVSWPRIAAGAQSGELYHLEVMM